MAAPSPHPRGLGAGHARLPAADAAGLRAVLVVADRAVVRDERPAHQPGHGPRVRRPRQLPRGAGRPAAGDRRAEHAVVRGPGAGPRLPGPAGRGGADERRPPGPRPVRPARVPAGRDPAGRRRAALEGVLRRRGHRRLQHHPRLGRPGPGAVARDGRHGHAVTGARGDLGGGRRHRDHLPGRARLGAPRAVRRGRGRRRRRLAQGLARHRAAPARHHGDHPDPADHRHRAGVPRALPVHRRRPRQRHADGPAARLPVRLPEHHRRRLRQGHRAQPDAGAHAGGAVAGLLPGDQEVGE